MTSTSPDQGPLSGFPTGISLRGERTSADDEILTPDALEFVADLERRFGATREFLLVARDRMQVNLDAGERLDFLPDTADVRAADWKIADVPYDLRDRTVEITGPVDRKMIINALNSGANVFMADFEDSNSPTWKNTIEGQINLRDAVRREIEFVHPKTGKVYELNDKVATLLVRPRGWHLVDKHLHVDGRPVSAGILDFGLYFFHNVHELIRRGSGPYFYLPKMESYFEARLWNSIFEHAQDALGIPRGTIKATVLIETITAAFQMDEILYELRDHSAGLNCGRWDYIFSFIKRFAAHPEFVMPDRATVGMDRHFLRSYSQLLIKTCHRRGAHAMGGMAAQIPIKDDHVRNVEALAKVHADKARESKDGHDGTWVAHPGLISIARAEFEANGSAESRLQVMREDVEVTAADLLEVPIGEITEAGLRQNLNVGILYLDAWLRGLGCVPLYNLMDDAATAEISRTQVWQWIRHGSRLDDGRRIDADLVREVMTEEVDSIRRTIGDVAAANSKLDSARNLFETLITSDVLPEFLTIPAYEHI